MHKYHIYHRSDPGFHIVTIQAEDDEAFMHNTLISKSTQKITHNPPTQTS